MKLMLLYALQRLMFWKDKEIRCPDCGRWDECMVLLHFPVETAYYRCGRCGKVVKIESLFE